MNTITINQSVIAPSKVVCIGRNYVDHIKELNNEMPEEIVFFIKPNSSIATSITFPSFANNCHYEAEISCVIEENKISAVGFGLDLTLREVQSKLKEKGLPWERAKAFDGSAVFSPFVPFDGDINELSLQLFINGELRQEGGVDLMIHKPQEIITEFTQFASFEDGDILMTGTPKGVGTFKQEDVFVGKLIYQNETLVEQRFVVL